MCVSALSLCVNLFVAFLWSLTFCLKFPMRPLVPEALSFLEWICFGGVMAQRLQAVRAAVTQFSITAPNEVHVLQTEIISRAVDAWYVPPLAGSLSSHAVMSGCFQSSFRRLLLFHVLHCRAH